MQVLQCLIAPGKEGLTKLMRVGHILTLHTACRDKAKRAAAEKKAEEKKAREEARLIERERKKAEALEAKRYPMEDMQLLQELLAKAESEGTSSCLSSLASTLFLPCSVQS